MSDTPPPDIPDPASPSPVSPVPADPAAARPRRVITRPDTMVTPRRQPGTVVTRPESAGGARLPGTYAANYGGDPSWKRGAFVLCLLLGLAATAEFVRALALVWSSSRGLPMLPETRRTVEIGRIASEAAIFLLLWVGWSWTRWVLILIDFFFGLFFVVTVVAPFPTPPGAPPVLNGGAIVSVPQMVLGVIYLLSAAYLTFSADVIGFTRHRRAEGRGWVLVPVALFAGACAFVVCSVQPYCQQKFEQWKPEAAQFATESWRAMVQNWDVAEYEKRADPEYLKVWTADQRKGTFGTLAGLGAAPVLPETKVTDEPKASVTRNGGSFQVSYACDFGKIRFAHGSAALGCNVSRSIGGVWQLQNLLVSEPENDPVPAPEAAPAPVPTPAGTPVLVPTAPAVQ